jgi:hypothetical protein
MGAKAMPDLSRRHLVTTVAALPALAVPAFASDVGDPNHPDAELLRLGVELDRVGKDWLAQRALDRREEANNVRNVDPELERWERIHGELYPLSEAILDCEATTLAGLAVQTHAFALMRSEWWGDNGGNDDYGGSRRLYIESVSSFLGIVPVPLQDEKVRKAA